MNAGKKDYEAPQLIVHGTIVDLTQAMKNKTFGGGDDVFVNNNAILANLS